MPSSPRRRIPLASVIGELTARSPGRASQRLRRLDASHGRQDHTVLPYASAPLVCRAADRSQAKARPAIRFKRSGRCRVHRILTHVRDDRDTPLLAGRNGLTCRTDLGEARRSMFLKRGLDGANQVDWVEEIRSSGFPIFSARRKGKQAPNGCSAADVAGWNRLIGDDEERRLALLAQMRFRLLPCH
jgi:hypothetical protein